MNELTECFYEQNICRQSADIPKNASEENVQKKIIESFENKIAIFFTQYN